MIKVYCYSKCSTCKKALNWLDENKIEYELIDIKTNNPDYDTLKNIIDNSGIEIRKFFNTSGILYREMNLSSRIPDMNKEEMLHILSSDGMLVKRPLLIRGNDVLLGFNIEKWTKFFNC